MGIISCCCFQLQPSGSKRSPWLKVQLSLHMRCKPDCAQSYIAATLCAVCDAFSDVTLHGHAMAVRFRAAVESAGPCPLHKTNKGDDI